MFSVQFQVDESVQEVHIPTLQPCVIMKGTFGEGIKEAALFVYKNLITTFEPKNVIIILLSAYYSYNMHYSDGCTDFYTVLESLCLKQKIDGRKVRIAGVVKRIMCYNLPC